MTIGTNIPGTTSFYLNKQKYPIGSGPTAPIPTVPTSPTPTKPATPPFTPQPQMGGYVNSVAQKPPAPVSTPSFNSYRTPTVEQRPQATVPPPTPTQTPPYTPPSTAAPTAPATPYPTASTDPSAKAGTPGSSLQDPGQLTEAGKMYAQRVTQNLQGGDPLAKNAQQSEDTAAARRGYLGRRTTQESLAQTSFNLGSAQYQRAMDESQATVNAANQQGQNSVNEFTRKTTQDNLAAANKLEDQQYGRAVGERTRGDLQTQDYASTLPEGPARYAYKKMVASGVSPQDALNAILGQNGQVNPTYRGQTPGALEVQGSKDNAEAWVASTTDLQPGTKEYTDAVRKRMQAVDKSTQAPLNDAVTAADTKAIEEDLKAGKTLTPEQQDKAIRSGAIKEFTLGNIPKYTDVGVNDLVGKPINIGGKVYTYLAGGRNRTGAGTFSNQERHTDYAAIKDANGKTWYVYDGTLNEKAPKSVSNDISPFGF